MTIGSSIRHSTRGALATADTDTDARANQNSRIIPDRYVTWIVSSCSLHCSDLLRLALDLAEAEQADYTSLC